MIWHNRLKINNNNTTPASISCSVKRLFILQAPFSCLCLFQYNPDKVCISTKTLRRIFTKCGNFFALSLENDIIFCYNFFLIRKFC